MQFGRRWSYVDWTIKIKLYEEFENNKREIKIRKLKDKQHNNQKTNGQT